MNGILFLEVINPNNQILANTNRLKWFNPKLIKLDIEIKKKESRFELELNLITNINIQPFSSPTGGHSQFDTLFLWFNLGGLPQFIVPCDAFSVSNINHLEARASIRISDGF